MISVLSTNITSPLGMTSEANYKAVRAGRSALARLENWHGMPSPFTASVFSESQLEELKVDGFSRFESMVIRSVMAALDGTCIDVGSDRTVFILSTTKANVEALLPYSGDEYLDPGRTAEKIGRHLGFVTEPVVVCNACTSGVTAQILADRLVSSGRYDTAVVCGADCVSLFTAAGFLSFRSLSVDECRPFDMERTGLNLGEAAATVVFGNPEKYGDADSWKLCSGALNNDAYDISAPSPAGDGVLDVIGRTLTNVSADELATVCVHGTATMFNDQMESKAIERASLSSVPLTALKGYFGHTLGASGVLETIIVMQAVDDGVVLPVRGFSELGVSGRVNVSNEMSCTDKRSFLKLISGFGGCNGALVMSHGNDACASDSGTESEARILHSVRITDSSLVIDGHSESVSSRGKQLLTDIYTERIGDFPKFYRMDMLSRLAFVASELLMKLKPETLPSSGIGVLLFNQTTSILADRQHISTISDTESFFPSPSAFLYTLPNIVTGEIAIRNGCRGETSMFILNGRNEEMMDDIIKATLSLSNPGGLVTGWADCCSEDTFEADMKLIIK